MLAEKNSLLVVDDELLIRDLVYDFFNSHGVTVRLAEDGLKARQMIEEVGFQVALVDLRLPGASGLEVARAISSSKPAVPVILMTAFPSLESAIESVRAGIFDYVIKPFKMTELLAVVQRAFAEYAHRTNHGYAPKSEDRDQGSEETS